ncbi:hypothetical protein P280DRAFT_39259 [Massarina eburnea CBS 473.64]|uniref:Homeodomain-like protein n=1 Tax=Massarina eburnea CBS 473.64 TaxID=1395130 RepID=A0A6A6RZZ4_9PLEO|nr:hypothetical protein P280DRAFT_39259 [Massarina eburnea CBS 473.64]
MSRSASHSMARIQRKWTVTEDHKLREEVETQMIEGEVKDWCRIATKLPGRTNKDCRKRWYNSVTGGLRKGQWAKSEDIQLARGVQQYGQRWTLVANVVGSRSADQCAKRWQQSLDPDLDRSEWREAEDKVLIDAVHRLGRHWKDIQRQHFPGRSKNCIKNRYTVLVRRYQGRGITLPQPAITPEPSTASLSPRGSDDTAYSPGVYDDVLSSNTPISTPETRHSWPIEDDTFSTWTSGDSFEVMSAPDYSHIHQPPQNDCSHGQQWQWIETSMSQPTLMHVAPPTAYPQIPSPGAIPSYDAYGTASMLSPNPIQYHGISAMRALTNSPSPIASTSPPYQDQQDISSYMRYGMPRDHPYQY